MAIPDETIRLYLARHGDDWSATAQRGGGFKPLAPAPELDAAGDSPGGVLEAIGQTLDAREAERHREARGLPRATDVAQDEDVARVIEVLEDANPSPLLTADVCRIAGFADPPHPMSSDGTARTLRALRRAQAAGAVAAPDYLRDVGQYVWRLVGGDRLVANGHHDDRDALAGMRDPDEPTEAERLEAEEADAERRLERYLDAQEAEAADRDAQEDRDVDAHRRRSARDDARGEADR